MANNTGVDFAADMLERINNVSATLVWGEQSVEVDSNGIDYNHDSEDVGYVEVIAGEIAGPVSLFTNSIPPPIGTNITINGIAVRVNEKQISEEGTLWRGSVTNV